MKDYSKCEIEFFFERAFPGSSHKDDELMYVYWRIKPSGLTLWNRWFHRNPWRRFEHVFATELNPLYSPETVKQELSHLKTYEQAMDYRKEQLLRACEGRRKLIEKKLTMKETDIKELKKWLADHGYYVGDSAVANALRELADQWDD